MASRTAIISACVALGVISSAALASDHSYRLSFVISHQGEIVGSPAVVVKDGVPGSIEVSGADGYSLSFTTTDAGAGKIRIATQFTSPSGTSSPTIIVKDGQSGSLSDGNYEFKVVATRQGS